MTHKEIIELMQLTVGHAIDDSVSITLAKPMDRRHMLSGLSTPHLMKVMNFVSSFHPDQTNPGG